LILSIVLYSLHVLVCVFLILVVLLQQGKGADLSVFGGGSTQAAFGARGATTLLHKLTVGSFIIFIVTTMSIAVLQNKESTSSVMSGATLPAPTTPAAQPAESPSQPVESPATEGQGKAAAAPQGSAPAPADAGATTPPPQTPPQPN
jgi:preprotein translocase subunit SecG